MQLKVICDSKPKLIRDVEVGDLILCEEGYRPVKSKFLIVTNALFYRLSNGVEFHIYDRILIKTKEGYKLPELWESIVIDNKLEPVVVLKEYSQNIMILYDILVDGSIVSPEGIIIKYGNN